MMTQSDENSNKTSNFIQMGDKTKWIWPFLIPIMGSSFSEMVLSSPQVIGLIEKNEKYDVILGEMFFVEAAIAGFSYKSKASIIGIAGFMPNIWANHLVIFFKTLTLLLLNNFFCLRLVIQHRRLTSRTL